MNIMETPSPQKLKTPEKTKKLMKWKRSEKHQEVREINKTILLTSFFPLSLLVINWWFITKKKKLILIHKNLKNIQQGIGW